MIYITCGTCGTSKGYKTQADGAISLPPSEEARLVARSVASYVTKPIIGTESGVVTSGEDGDGSDRGDTPPERAPASTGLETGESETGGEDEDTAKLQDGEVEASDALDIVDGHFTKESLLQMQRPEMEKLAAEFGIDTRKCRNKGEIADLLVAVEVEPGDDGEAPPELGAEAPLG